MPDKLVFPYVINRQYAPDERARPFLPITLKNQQHEVETLALVDSGADMCILPYDVGVKLGGDWDKQQRIVGLSGLVGQVESRAFVVDLFVGNWRLGKLGFAWTSEPDVAVILGQVDFFSVFNVCFMRSTQQFELELARPMADIRLGAR